jgi:hypothetical protein
VKQLHSHWLCACFAAFLPTKICSSKTATYSRHVPKWVDFDAKSPIFGCNTPPTDPTIITQMKKATPFYCFLFLLTAHAGAQTLDTLPFFGQFTKVVSMAADAQSLWLGTAAGAVQLRKSDGKVLSVFNSTNSPLEKGPIETTAVGPDGTVWLNGHGWTGEKWVKSPSPTMGDFTQQEFDFYENHLSGTAFLPLGVPVIGQYQIQESHSCGFVRTGLAQVRTGPDNNIWAIDLDFICGGSPSGCGCLTRGKDLVRLENGAWTPVIQQITDQNFAFGPDSSIWVMDGLGASRFDFQSGVKTFATGPMQGNFIAHGLEIDPSGRLWAIQSGQVMRADPPGFVWQISSTGLASANVNVIFTEKTGDVWVGTDGDGVYRWDGAMWQSYSKKLMELEVTGSVGDSWLLARRGCAHFDGMQWKPFSPDSVDLPDKPVRTAYLDDSKHLWLAYSENGDAYNGLARWDGQQFERLTPSNCDLASFDIQTIQSDSAGRIWFGFTTDGCGRYDATGSPVWQNFATSDTLLKLFYHNGGWSYSGKTVYHTTAGSVQSFPLDSIQFAPGLFELALPYATVLNVWPNGTGWARGYYNYLPVYYFFNGSKWETGQPANTGYPATTGYYIGSWLKDAIFIAEDLPNYAYGIDVHAAILKKNGTYVSVNLPNNCGDWNLGSQNNRLFDCQAVESKGGNIWLYHKNPPYTYGYSLPCTHPWGLSVFNQKGDLLAHFDAQLLGKAYGDAIGFERDAAGNTWLVCKNARLALDDAIPAWPVIFGEKNSCGSGTLTACVLGGGRGPYQFDWQHGEVAGPVLNDLAENPLEVTVIDFTGKTTATERHFDAPLPIVPQLSSMVPSAPGSKDGRISIDGISGGQTPFTVNWLLPDSSVAHSWILDSLTNGLYHLKITDANGCVYEGVRTLASPAAVLATASGWKCPGDSTGSVVLQVSGGLLPYVYEWSNGTSSAQNVSTIALPGQVACRVRDAGTFDTLLYFNFINPPLPVFSQPETGLQYTDQPQNLAKIRVNLNVGGTPPYKILLNDTLLFDGLFTPWISPNIYHIKLKDANGCLLFDKDENVFGPLQAQISAWKMPHCPTDSTGVLKVRGQYGVPPFQYTWFNGASTDTLAGLPGGVYHATVTDALGTTKTSGFNLTSPTGFYFSGIDTVQNINGTYTLTAFSAVPPPITIHWSTGQTSTTIYVPSPGTYSVTATDQLGCTLSGQITLGVVSQTEVQAPANDLLILPNPSLDGNFRVLNVDNQLVEVFDAAGRWLTTKKIGADQRLDLMEMPAGVYFFRVEDGRWGKGVKSEE